MLITNVIKHEKEISHNVVTVLNLSLQIVKRAKIDTMNTQIHNRSLSLLGTGTSLKSGGLTLHQQIVMLPIMVENITFTFLGNDKNVDIKFSAHDAFLEKPSSGTLKTKILENQIILKIFGGKKTKGPIQNYQNRLR